MRLWEEWGENLGKKYVVGGVLIYLSKPFGCVSHDLCSFKSCCIWCRWKLLFSSKSETTRSNQ